MHPLGQQPSAAAQAATAALARQGSVRKGSRAHHQPVASSPSQSTLSHHSFTQHGADRQHQDDSFNPQLEDDFESARYGRAASHSISQQVAVRPSMTTMAFSTDNETGYGASVSPPHYRPMQPHAQQQHSQTRAAPSPFFGRSAAFEEHQQHQQQPSEGSSGGGMGRVDPTPLLTTPGASGGSNTLASLPSTPSLFSSSDPYRPVRRWLFDFPSALTNFFWGFDNAVTKFVQIPLATVGGADVCLEEEILESDAYANQSRRAAEERRRRKEGKAGFVRGSANHDDSIDGSNSHDHDPDRSSHPGHSRTGSRLPDRDRSTTTVLQKSLAITWSNKVLVGVALGYTALTTIELGVVCPLFLFLIGMDQLATLALFSTLCAGLLSQLFKRFLWRPRPWMLGRAIQVKRDLTSSFPSRAVICAVVYSFIFSHVFLHHVPPEVYLPIVFVFALGASVSRIFVGAHYASDCLFGFGLGVLICVLGDLLNHAVEYACGSCFDRGSCYAWSFEQRLTGSTLSSLDVASLLSVTFVSLALVGLAMSSPLQFWTKVLPVFGPLAPCLAFRLVNLCPRHNDAGVALLKMRLPSPGVIVLAAVIALAALAVCKAVNKLIVIERPSQLTTEHEDEQHTQGGAGDEAHTSRRSLQCSSWRTTAWNLSVFLFVFATIFIGLSAWRIHATPEDF